MNNIKKEFDNQARKDGLIYLAKCWVRDAIREVKMEIPG